MIEIVPYQMQWPEEFQQIAGSIRQAVQDNAIAIHHIGSTSVPGLAAKDVIDIQMTVLDFETPIQEVLKEIGFELSPYQQDHCPPGIQLSTSELEKRHFWGKIRKANLHVRRQGRFNQRYPLLFRDFLRTHLPAANAYAEIKIQLAKYFPNNADAYYDIKDPVCDALMAGAFEWAKNVGWTPGESEA